MKDLTYKVILDLKKGSKEFPNSIQELAIAIKKYERKEKINKLKLFS